MILRKIRLHSCRFLQDFAGLVWCISITRCHLVLCSNLLATRLCTICCCHFKWETSLENQSPINHFVCVSVCLYLCLCLCSYVCVYMSVCVMCICVCACLCVCAWLCICLCVCLWCLCMTVYMHAHAWLCMVICQNLLQPGYRFLIGIHGHNTNVLCTHLLCHKAYACSV